MVDWTGALKRAGGMALDNPIVSPTTALPQGLTKAWDILSTPTSVPKPKTYVDTKGANKGETITFTPGQDNAVTTEAPNVPTTTPAAVTSPDSVDFRPGTAWDTSPEYAVVSRLSAEDRKKLEGTGNGYALSQNAANLTLKYLKDAGVEIDNGLRMQFMSSVEDASREWAQMQAASGRSINATSYMYFLSNLLLTAQQGQTAAAATTTEGGAPSEDQVNAAIQSGMQLVDPTGQVDYTSYNARSAEQAKEKMEK
jgi:hypothetical protein